MNKIFISHSSLDVNVAIEICDFLENLEQPCWYSERDLNCSTNFWQDELIRNLNNCRAVVLVMTKSALMSGEVLNEIATASAQNKLIIPFFMEEVPLTQVFEYYLRKYEWILAYKVSYESAYKLLCEKIVIENKNRTASSVDVHVDDLLLNENPCFQDVQYGGYGVGFNKCLVSNGKQGWAPDQIYIESINEEDFTFDSIGKSELDEAYNEFCSTPEFQKMESRGNNQTRWMLTDIYQNEKLYLSLQKTKWSKTTFWWNQVRNNIDKQRILATQTFQERALFYPNSLCMHLVIETADELLLCSQISINKRNDYAHTIAVTIGEQIEKVDFSSGTLNNNHFIFEWCKRALIEEFGFTNDNYHLLTDESSIRVLGINYEGDIYNFALPTYVKLNLTYENLIHYQINRTESNTEFTKIIAMTQEEVLETLQKAGDEKFAQSYHPSSFLRMLQYLQYKQQS